MNDDAFTHHLRELAEGSPHIRVDRDHVIRAGRRRRSRRTAGVAAMTVAGVAGLYTGVAALPLTGDGSSPAGPPASVAPAATPSEGDAVPAPELASAAVVDAVTGTIELPLDELLLSGEDWGVIDTATELAIATCMAEQGYGEYYVFQGPEPAHPDRLQYGVWLEAEVRATGYQSQRADDGRARVGLPLTDEADAALLGCFGEGQRLGFVYDGESAGLESLAPLGYEMPAYTDEGQAIIAEWGECLRAGGVTPPEEDSSMVPAGVLDAPMDEQVRVGLVDVACKDQLDTVQRLADVEAAEHLAYIDRAQEYLDVLRPLQQEVLANAQAYLAAQGVDVG